MKQRTLVLVKPDGVQRRLVGEIMSRIEAKTLEIRALRLMNVDEELAKKHYEEHIQKPFFPELLAFITSGPIVAMVVEGDDAVTVVRDLMSVPGMGPAKAAEVVAALERGRRAARALAAERPQIWRPCDAAALLMPRMAHLDREESVVMVLDRRHRILREVSVGIGGVAHSPMEPREVFAAALREPGAAALIVAHHHPSGEPT